MLRSSTVTLSTLLFLLLTAVGEPVAADATTPWLVTPIDSPSGFTVQPPAPLDPAIPSPAAILGYPPGERFTPHHRILDVLDVLASASDRLRIETYGATTEARPLRLVVASSPANLDRLESILSHRRQAVTSGDLALLGDHPAVVWLGFGVHGNETSSSEAAMAVLHLLAAAEPGSSVAEWLDRLVVVIDPVSNPDGRQRYVGWYRSVRSHVPDPDRHTLEHHEPWPGGRQNHYLFDLNRDWAWATQIETQARLAAFHRFAPDVAVDVHEMRPDTTYFFPPAAEPFHPGIPTNVLDWLGTFGQANAETFDRYAWPYFNHEVYDFLYPGYGDTYPSLTGAVGMTYEMAGGGRAGLDLHLEDGRRRTLAGRTARHTLAVTTTLATAARAHRELARDAVTRRRNIPPGSYLWAADQAEARALAELLERHGISVGQLGTERTLEVEPILPGKPVARRFTADTFVARAEPPTGRLLHALMERQATLSDAFVERQRQRVENNLAAELYDVTAWSLPLAYDVETWRLDTRLDIEPRNEPPIAVPSDEGTAQGWLVRPQGLVGYRFAARLLAQGVRLRRLVEPAPAPALPGGTLFVPRHANPDDLDDRVATAIADTGARVEAVASAWTDIGPSLGSNRWRPARMPKIGLVAGRGIDVPAHGHLWHLFDQLIGIRVSRLDTARLATIELDAFDVLVLPDGNYDAVDTEVFERWLRAGGTAVAVARAVDWFREHGWSAIEATTAEGDAATAQQATLRIAGAAIATRLSPSSPLAAGVSKPPAVLFRGARYWQPLGDIRADVLVARDKSPVLAGLVWPEAAKHLDGTLLVADEAVGRGRLVAFNQDPAFRGFWRATMPLLLNAVLFGSS